MKKELLRFIREKKLSPFNRLKTSVKGEGEEIYKTKDARLIHNKVLSKLASEFYFSDTSNLFNFFYFTSDLNVIKERRKFFETISEVIEGSFLNSIGLPRKWWRPKYGVIVVTEDEKTFTQLQKLGCPVSFLVSETSLSQLEDYDIVQVIDCENFSRALEGLPQSVFLDSIDEVFLERFVQELSGWKENLSILKGKMNEGEIMDLVSELDKIMFLLEDGEKEVITREKVEESLGKINQEISVEVKKLTVSGESLFSMLSNSKIPDELMNIIRTSIGKTEIPGHLFIRKIPVEIDDEELDKLIKTQNAKEHTSIAEKVKKESDALRKVPERLQELSDLLILFDFISGLSKYIAKTKGFPVESEELRVENSSNLFLDSAQPISFNLNSEHRCSILTGANSGGKTTLLEHIIQLVSLFQLGLPIIGNVKIPMFSEIYYFAKNKGSMNKGAFETLLTQMSKIKSGERTLILADEIESVTEPGVAGAIVCASAEYFIKRGCFMVVATHLGKEIQGRLPSNSRIDGIEAKGLDENFNLIVDHNPVLGRLANSTPELIVAKMANSERTEYFEHLHAFLKGGN